MIQEIAPRRFDNHYQAAAPGPDDYVLHYAANATFRGADANRVRGNGMLAAEVEGRLVLPRLKDYAKAPQTVYLFSIDEERFFLAVDVLVEAREPFQYLSISSCRFFMPRYLAFAAVTGFQLWDWRQHNRYCGVCATPLVHAPRSRELVCPACGNIVYPRINIGVIVAIVDGERLLLTKYAGRPIKHYALVAGYTEVGETLEECCRREIMEEVGLHVKDLTYVTNQPWSFTDTLLVGYFARLDGPVDLKVDHGELKLAEWIERRDLPKEHEDTSSMTNWMIELFAKGEDPFSRQR